MTLKFLNSKKKMGKGNSVTKGTVNPNGHVEIVSKNFTMTTNPNTKKTKSEDASTVISSATWICWGCGHTNTEDICSVCGKKRTK